LEERNAGIFCNKLDIYGLQDIKNPGHSYLDAGLRRNT